MTFRSRDEGGGGRGVGVRVEGLGLTVGVMRAFLSVITPDCFPDKILLHNRCHVEFCSLLRDKPEHALRICLCLVLGPHKFPMLLALPWTHRTFESWGWQEILKM